MEAKKALLIGTGVAVATGILISTLLSATMLRAGASSNDAPMTIPPGAVGDQVAYATFNRTGPTDAWKPAGSWGFKVLGLNRTPDSTNRVHNTISVALDKRFVNETFGLLAEYKEHYGVTDRLQIRLGDRAVVARDLDNVGEGTYAALVRGPWDAGVTWFGPFPKYLSAGGWSDPPAGVVGFYPLRRAGNTYQLNQELPHESLLVFFDYAVDREESDMFDGDTALTNLGERSWVAGRLMVDGHDAYDIRSEGCLRAKVVPERYYKAFDDGISFLHTKIPNGSKVCFRVDVWVSADIAYPILYEEETIIDDQISHEYLENLAGLQTGQGTIPWVDPAPMKSMPAAFELTEGNQRYPGDGTGSRIEFPLSEAVAAVDGDLSLLRFHQWRQSHAESMLIGAQLDPLNDDRLEWDLTFGAPGGSAFVASSERNLRLGTIQNTENGEFSMEPFRVEDFGQHQLTIGAAEAMWLHNARSEAEPLTPNTVNWGYQYRDPGAYCSPLTECKFRPARLSGLSDWSSNLIIVGHWSPKQVLSAAYVERPAPPQPISAIYAHTAPADLWISAHAASYIDFTPMNVAGAIPKEPPAGPASASKPFSPDLAVAALVSSSLLAAFLAAYFFPLERFFGAGAFGAILGYAKLRRSALLDQKTRDELAALIRREPGISTSDLAKTVPAGWSTIVYHLRVLEKNKLVSSLVDGRHKRFFPVDGLDWGKRERLSVLKNIRTRELYETILDEPGVIQRALAQRAGISKAAVHWHLRRLEGVGLVGHDKLGRRVHYYPANPAERPPAPPAMEVA